MHEDDRAWRKAAAAAAYLRREADNAQAAVGRAEEKLTKFIELLAESERGLSEAQSAAARAAEEAAAAEAQAGEMESAMGRSVYAQAGVAQGRGMA